MANENAVRNLIRIDDKENPTLFRALQLLVDDLYKINNVVFPVSGTTPIEEGISESGILPPVQNFIAIAYPTNLRLDWDNLQGAFRYQIKMGDNWDTARHIVSTATDVANVDPLFLNLIYGTYNFLIRPVNLAGILGETASTQLVVPTIPPPDLALEVVVSTVLLRWTVPTSTWKIDYYIIYKDGIQIGTIAGTFKLIQEQVGGTYTYTVAAVDIVGNVSTISASKIADLHDPSEFEFVDEVFSQYNGDFDKTNIATIDGILGIVGPIQVQTWEEHYVVNVFNTPQDQIDAGYPVYFQPSYIGEGTYEEIFDFGQVYEDLTVVADYNKRQLLGTTNVISEISYSDDGIIWSTPVIGNSILAESVRYVKVKWIFSNTDDKSLAFISNLKVVLNVTLTLDSGSEDVFAADVEGTEIFYNKDFTGMNSVTATAAISLQPLYAVTDDVTNISFKVLVFDSSGNRVNARINWKARGVV